MVIIIVYYICVFHYFEARLKKYVSAKKNSLRGGLIKGPSAVIVPGFSGTAFPFMMFTDPVSWTAAGMCCWDTRRRCIDLKIF